MTAALLIDTSFAARPIHDFLLAEGLDVWTIGNRPNDLLARRNPQRYIFGDYSNVLEVQDHVRRVGIEYVIPGCTDVSMETAIRLCGIKSVFDAPETSERIANKAAFRQLCSDLGLCAPRRVAETELPLPYKLIAKPSVAFSGRGITVFDGTDPAAAAEALKLAKRESRDGEALMETFIDGQLYSFSLFLEHRRIAHSVFVRENGSVSPFAVDTSYVEANFPASGRIQIQSGVEQLADALQLVDGLLHVQFIWDGDRPWFIEVSRRCPGDLYPRLVELGSGFRHAAQYASYFVGASVSQEIQTDQRFILRHTVTAAHRSYEFLQCKKAQPLLEFHALARIG
jgi:biotin carboxylase